MKKIIYTLVGLLLFAIILVLPSIIDSIPMRESLPITIGLLALLGIGIKIVNRYATEEDERA